MICYPLPNKYPSCTCITYSHPNLTHLTVRGSRLLRNRIVNHLRHYTILYLGTPYSSASDPPRASNLVNIAAHLTPRGHPEGRWNEFGQDHYKYAYVTGMSPCFVKRTRFCVIAGFRCDMNGIFGFLHCYASLKSRWMATFREIYWSHINSLNDQSRMPTLKRCSLSGMPSLRPYSSSSRCGTPITTHTSPLTYLFEDSNS